jgi:hypothetical protein
MFQIGTGDNMTELQIRFLNALPRIDGVSVTSRQFQEAASEPQSDKLLTTIVTVGSFTQAGKLAIVKLMGAVEKGRNLDREFMLFCESLDG